MPYAILRFQKHKSGGVTAIERHDERKKEVYKSNPDIDLSRTQNNYSLIQPPPSYRKAVKQRIDEVNCKVRRDSVLMVETLVTASPEFMKALTPTEQKEFFQRAFDFLAQRVGKQNILAAAVHMDEKTPHMHLSFCPITKDNRLSAKVIIGNQAALSQWQTDFHEHMSDRWPELERGISSQVTRRKHIPVWLCKQAERLDGRMAEITAALSDINAFNAGKKREKALSIIAAWLPDAQKFTAQVKTVDHEIEHLHDAYLQANNVTERYRDKSYELEESLMKAERELYGLRQKFDKQAKLLSRIPPQVLEELTTSRKNKDKER